MLKFTLKLDLKPNSSSYTYFKTEVTTELWFLKDVNLNNSVLN